MAIDLRFSYLHGRVLSVDGELLPPQISINQRLRRLPDPLATGLISKSVTSSKSITFSVAIRSGRELSATKSRLLDASHALRGLPSHERQARITAGHFPNPKAAGRHVSMMLPIRRIRSPRLTMGQSLASIAVGSLGLAAPRTVFRHASSFGDYAIGFFVCVTLVFLVEVLFWGVFVAAFPALRKALGKPTWFRFELEVDPRGIDWVDERARTTAPVESEDAIHWVE